MMVIVFSATKGLSGLAMALVYSRGLFDYDEQVSTGAKLKGKVYICH